MAIVKNSIVLQGASGTLGEFYVRKFRGKIILARKPIKRNVSHSSKAVNVRKNFAAAVLMSKTINSQPLLREIWESSEIKASSPYQKMMAFHSKHIKDGVLSASNVITPEGIPLKLKSAYIQDYSLYVDFNLKSEDFITFPAHIILFLYFVNLKKTIFALNDNIPAVSPDANYSMSFPMDINMKKALRKDSNPVLFAAVVGSYHHKEKEYWSDTAVIQL